MIEFLKGNRFIFPDAGKADQTGLLAVGGNLFPVSLIRAYSKGIFPWYDEESPILWWSPDPRLVLFPREFKVSKSLRQTLKNNPFEIRFDHDFNAVITHCAAIPREGQHGTWITAEMMEAYKMLHQCGYAHSVEAYRSGRLAGGLYGVSLGKAFFGESMFFIERDASKAALFHLVQRMLLWGFHFIDAQQETDHLKSLGAGPVARKEFMELLKKALRFKTKRGKW
ncbi:MAG: leucyl/phenylalanyl-tRNA--protein transferase [Bacteroidales bacterium]|nr:leucyl/phenylalanyl-tRNA--protein transferase [Bacteroidales bacterium]